MSRIILSCLTLAACLPVLGASLGLSKSYGDFDRVVFHSCYDGDTCTFSIPGVHPLLGEKISIRLAGIDTPEIRGKCPKEKNLAKEAKAFVNRVLGSASRIRLLNVRRGKYFSIVAEIEADGGLLGGELMRRGLAFPYEGGIKKSWC